MPDITREATCIRCGQNAAKPDLFCRHCGQLLGPPPECFHHPHRQARGICVVCFRPCCEECGNDAKGMFLCNIHAICEIRDESALVFETADAERAHRVLNQLRQAGLHPLEHEEAAGSLDTALMYPEGGGTEMQIYVPFREFEQADDVLAANNDNE